MVDSVSPVIAIVPAGVPEELQPILEILPLQQLAYEVTIARGQDPDAPRALAEVTETHWPGRPGKHYGPRRRHRTLSLCGTVARSCRRLPGAAPGLCGVLASRRPTEERPRAVRADCAGATPWCSSIVD